MTQDEANRLIQMPKRFRRVADILVSPGMKREFVLTGIGYAERFVFDLTQTPTGTMAKLQTRHRPAERPSVVLVRIDLGEDQVHKNPDRTRIFGPHIHIYDEVWHDLVAHKLPDEFSAPHDLLATAREFWKFCHIIEAPKIAYQGALSL